MLEDPLDIFYAIATVVAFISTVAVVFVAQSFARGPQDGGGAPISTFEL